MVPTLPAGSPRDGTSVPAVEQITDVLGLDALLAQFILAVGAAMVLGNGFAIWKHRKGEAPDVEGAVFRSSRAWWLLSVGLLITIWGVASLVS